MSGKEFLQKIILYYFIVVALITVVIGTLGLMFRPEQTFGYDAFFSPLFYGAVSMIPYAFVYSKKELSIKELLIRKVLQLIFIEVALFLITFGFSGAQSEKESPGLRISFCVSVFLVYVFTHVIGWFVDSRQAKLLTEDLKKYQQQ